MRHRLIPLALAASLATLPAAAQDHTALAEMLDGTMQKLVFHPEPQEVDAPQFADFDGADRSLDDFAGQIVVLNFWATWCAPCREEMPALDRLQAELGGDDFAVVAVATGRNPPAAITRFFAETGLEHLTIYTDPRQEMARNMAVLGLPITVVLDREGREIARMRGDAHWDSDSAMAMLRALIASS